MQLKRRLMPTSVQIDVCQVIIPCTTISENIICAIVVISNMRAHKTASSFHRNSYIGRNISRLVDVMQMSLLPISVQYEDCKS